MMPETGKETRTRGSQFRPLCAVKNLLACLLGLLAGVVGLAEAEVTYDAGTPPMVTASSLINTSFQANEAPAAFSAFNESAIPVNATATGVVSLTTEGNTLSSTVSTNIAALDADPSLVSGSDSGSSLASVNAQENYGISVFSRVGSTGVTATVTAPETGSSVSLSGNGILAEASLNQSGQYVSGTLDTSFDSVHDGTATLAADDPQLAGDAGLFAGSSQVNVAVGPVGEEANLAEVSGSNTIALTADGALGDSLGLQADANSISAAFTGNNAENLLSVEAGEGTALTSSAGIANLQVNSEVGAPYGDSASIGDGASISATLSDDALVSGSLSFDHNQLSASATGSVADNQLEVAAGLDVAADGDQANRLDFTPGYETATTSGGLFLNNVQLAVESPVSATAHDPAAGAALGIDSRGLIDSALTADGNRFEAIALGNDASGSIGVGGATGFTSAVAASNLQDLNFSTVSATADAGTLAVNLGGSPALEDLPENDITGSTISLSDNNVSALAVGNRDPLLVNISGTNVADGQDQVVATGVDSGDQTLETTAGFSAISSQTAVNGSSVSATNTNAGINLAAGGYPVATGLAGPHVSDSTFTVADNSLTSLANLNEGLVAVGIEANQINGSSAVAAVQSGSESDVSATTSGTIAAGVNTRTSGDPDTPASMPILVGDGDLADEVFAGNTISASAGGNVNAAALDVNAATDLQVTGVIARDGLPSTLLDLTSAGGLANQAAAEMTVLTDQRLLANAVSATTDPSRITGTTRISSDPLRDSTLRVDGNRVSATARGNLTSNSLDFSALSVDLSGADAIAGAAGSNLAATGAVQVIGEASSVVATVDAAANNAGLTNAEIQGMQAGSGDLTNFGLSVDGNTVTATATGNDASSRLSGSGGTLVEDAPGDLAGVMALERALQPSLEMANAALANGVVQVNAGSVAARLGSDQAFEINARTSAANNEAINSKDVVTSTVSADSNRAVALATGSSAEADTSLAFTTLESSAMTAVQQTQAGTTTATAGGEGGVAVTVMTPLNTNLVGSTLSASGNTAGAQATAATAVGRLAAGGADTVTLASGYSADASEPLLMSDTLDGEFAGEYVAGVDYLLGMQQTISGLTEASAAGLLVMVQGGDLAGGRLAADGNFLTAQAGGGTSSADLSLAASDMTAGGSGGNTVSAALVSDQVLSSGVGADLGHATVTTRAVNLAAAATGSNDAEAVSVDDNTLLASATGLSTDNRLTTDAGTSVAGNPATEPVDLGVVDVAVENLERAVVSNQLVTGDVQVSAVDTGVAIDIHGATEPYLPTAADVQGDSLSVDGNTLLAQGTGARSSNLLATSAGASIDSLSQRIVSLQDSHGEVSVDNFGATATLQIGNSEPYIPGDTLDSSLSVAANQLAATATGLAGDNTLSMSAGAALADAIASLHTNEIDSLQVLDDGAAVDADLDYSRIALAADGFVGDSSLAVEDNLQEAYAQGATNSNTLSATGGSVDEVAFGIQAEQFSTAPILASNDDGRIDLDTQTDVAGSNLSVAGNTISAVAGNLAGTNQLAVDAQSSNTGDWGDLEYQSDDYGDADRFLLSRQGVDSTGDVRARVDNEPSMGIYVGTDLEDHSVAALDGNRISAEARVATERNRLNNTAGTQLTSSALLGSTQSSDADATALINEDGYESGFQVVVDDDLLDSTISLSGNQVSASAAGLIADNALQASGTSVFGDDGSGEMHVGEDYQALLGVNALGSQQDAEGEFWAQAQDLEAHVDIWDDAYNSTVKVDNNLVQAAATAASASNSLRQQSASLSDDAAALLANSQEVYGESHAELYDIYLGSGADYAVEDSTFTSNENVIQSLAKGSTATNALDVTTGSLTGGLDLGSLNSDPDSHEVDGSSVLGSVQYGDSYQYSIVEDFSIDADADEGVYGSTFEVNRNLVQAASNAATANNSLNQHADTAMAYAPAQLGAAQEVYGESSAGVVDGDFGSWSYYEDIGGSSIAVEDNLVQASAQGGKASNSLNVSAGSLTGGMDFLGSGHLSAGDGYPGQGMGGYSTLSSVQYVSADQYANVDSLDMEVGVEDGDLDAATVSLQGNVVKASAGAASVSNSLNQQAANTMIDAPALLAALQDVSSDTEAHVTDTWLKTISEDDIWDSSVFVQNNQFTATVTGASMTNEALVSASRLQGENPIGQLYTATGGYPDHELYGYSLLSSVQHVSADLLAQIEYSGAGVDVDDDVANSTLKVDGNLAQASATAAAATNTLNQLADTAMADAPALLAASQEISGNTVAEISAYDDYSAWFGTYIDWGTRDSRLTVDDNTIQVLATGGSMTNYVDPGAGTRLEASNFERYFLPLGNLTLDPHVNSTETRFDGTYGLASRQVSTASVDGAIGGWPEVSMEFDDDIVEDSALSVSGNTIRNQAVNLTADNTLVTAATTDLDNVRTGVLSFQDVTGGTSAYTYNADVWVDGYYLDGTAAVDDNLVVATATGGSVSNRLDVSGMSVGGAWISPLSSLETAVDTREAVSGDATQDSLLNVQARSGAVTAELNDDDGDLQIAADFADVDGNVSVDGNVLAAEARGLVADNNLELAAQTGIYGGSAALGSVQTSTDSVEASIEIEDYSYSGFYVDNGDQVGTATVDGNTAMASATSNLAINSLSAVAGTQIVGLGDLTTTTITTTGITAETTGLAVQNAQSGTGRTSSSITGMFIYNDLGSLDGRASVSDKSVLSQARGQAAQNSLVLNAGTSLDASASLANGQNNEGVIDARIDNGTIGLSAPLAPGATAATTVKGNTVQASGTANLALNSMDISGSLATSGGGSVIGGSNTSLSATADYAALNAQGNFAAVSSSVSDFSIGLSASSDSGAASVLNNAILADATGNRATNTFTINAQGGSGTADFAFNSTQYNSGSVSSSIRDASITLGGVGGGTFRATGNRIGATAIGNTSVSSIRSSR